MFRSNTCPLKIHSNQSSGFSLLELSIVIIITGLIIMAVASVTVAYNKFERNEKAKGTIEIAKLALDNFYSEQRRYPCPADPTLAPTDPNFGIENCTMATVPGAITLSPPNPILVGTFPKFAITPDPGDGNIRKPTALSEYIDPTKAQNKPFLDPWDHQLTYAVTTQLIGKTSGPQIGMPKDDRTDGKRGNIAVVDETGENTGGTEGNADYVIVSHGKNGLGARNVNNTLATACDTAYTLESENCDGDSRFVQGISNINDNNKPAYLDDYVTYSRVVDTNIWSKRRNLDGTIDENSIYNTNLNGDIGINTTNQIPNDLKLDINGIIEAKNIISAETVCGVTGTNCFIPETLYNIQCPPGQVIKQIQIPGGAFTASCQSVEILSTTNPTGCSRTCSTYHVVRGFNSSGCPVCSNDP